MSVPPSVVAIGLDAAHPGLLQRWMDAGHLPHLQRLRARGACGQLDSPLRHHRAETPWPTFLTGCRPETIGYWGPLDYDALRYRCADPGPDEGAYDFREHPPFYAGLGPEFPVAVFDVPQCVLRPDVEGVQALGWGSHSRMTPTASLPADESARLAESFGEHPLLDKDSISPHDERDRERFLVGLHVGIQRRADVVVDLLGRRRWSLLLTVFGESHSALHYLWHESLPHPVDRGEARPADDPLLAAFVAMDAAIGRIVAAAPRDATIVVFSAHGTRANSGDLGANVFLPEALYRWSFPGRYALGPGRAGWRPLPRPRLATRHLWWNELWNSRHEGNPLKYVLRRNVSHRNYLRFRLERLTGRAAKSPLLHMPGLFWLPASWYGEHWSSMRAFALPSYSDGYVRLNVAGRDGQGTVAEADYERTCDEVAAALATLRDVRKGTPLVSEVLRTRNHPADDDRRCSPADLVVHFDEEDDLPADTVESPILGRVGPIPYYRTGGHFSTGFVVGAGPGIAPAGTLAGSVLDLAPTLLALMEAPIPARLEGRPLLRRTSRQPVVTAAG